MKEETREEVVKKTYFVCEVCGMETTTRLAMARHERNHEVKKCKHDLTFEIKFDYESESVFTATCEICEAETHACYDLHEEDFPNEVLRPLHDWLVANNKNYANKFEE